MLLTEKHVLHPLPARPHIPLTKRPLDLLYTLFFVVHIPATLLIDLQTLYPPSITPSPLRALINFYISFSHDPLIAGAAGRFTGGLKEGHGYGIDSTTFVWFKAFTIIELLFQLPIFFLGIRALNKGTPKIYPLLLVYAASTATTVLPCVAYLLYVPSAVPGITPELGGLPLYPALTLEKRILLLASYIPFFLVPLIMTVDMGARVTELVKKGIEAEDTVKWK